MNRAIKILLPVSLLTFGLGFYLIWVGFNSVKSEIVSQPDIKNIATESGQVAGAETFKVGKVVDGDTIKLTTGETIRLLGVDTPETVDPRKPVQCFGKEASNKLKELLTDKNVILEKDVSDTDLYDRLLRFIYLPLDDGTTLFINDYLIREGYARVLTIPPDVKFSEEFLEASRIAREQKKDFGENVKLCYDTYMKKFFIQLVLLVVLIFGALIFYKSGLGNIQPIQSNLPQTQIAINGNLFNVEIANTPEARKLGLGGRTAIASNSGMLFVFEQEGTQTFWMKGMKIPIDFIWIRSNKVVDITKNAQPPVAGQKDQDLPIYIPREPVTKVLEVQAGLTDTLKIRIGDQIQTIATPSGSFMIP